MPGGAPLVSIIVPAWNSQSTLGETLRSAAAQTYRAIEIIIVDDGSTDGTAAVAEAFCKEEPRARLVRQENGGLSAARNRAVKESNGAWIAPLDADDLFHPTKIEKQLAAALDSPTPPGLVFCWYHDIDEDGLVLGSGPRWDVAGPGLKRLAYESPIHTPLILREAIDLVGGYDESLLGCEDLKIHLQIARIFPVVVVPEYLFGYRHHSSPSWRTLDILLDSWTRVVDGFAGQDPGLSARELRWIHARLSRIRAEERLGQGDYAHAFASFLQAILADPKRWGPYLLYRLSRTAARLVRGRRPKAAPVGFDEASTTEFYPADPDELATARGLFDALEARRFRKLAALERFADPAPR